MADIRFNDVRKVFDGVVALECFSLHIPSPTLVVLVGPSGCGKTTLLRLIAGLETPTSGTIMLGDERLDTQAARDRDVAMVFQNYALYPHMTVSDNLSFGLRVRRVARDEIERRVQDVAASLEIAGLLERKPAQLSGGQRQRVALGRAVIREPRVFLFDEPLSNLDARLRDEMRYLIRRLYERQRTTTVYVTHDQVEAMTIGELLVVLKDGRVHQVGPPAECYDRPADEFVASFLGSPPMNLIAARLAPGAASVNVGEGSAWVPRGAVQTALAAAGEEEITVGVRPENLSIGGEAGDGALALRGRVLLAETLGHETLTHIDVGGSEIIARSRDSKVGAGEVATISAPPPALHFFRKRTGERIDTGARDG